ncbi:MAG: hypothetical protein CMI30_13120 [Opitutae bacterium]|nr:hypothetical protein [Opitutae bacterium]|tara:strand:+ start:4470 stop:4802 length:333 start_codon:yes stop_codon:yes gene_type:complete
MGKVALETLIAEMSNYPLFSKLPARIHSKDTSELLGFNEHEISVLVSNKLLQPLGKPSPNSPKMFAKIDIFRLHFDSEWLSNAQKVISNNWKAKNSRKKLSTKHLEVMAA